MFLGFKHLRWKAIANSLKPWLYARPLLQGLAYKSSWTGIIVRGVPQRGGTLSPKGPKIEIFKIALRDWNFQALSGTGDSQLKPLFWKRVRPIRTNHSNFWFARITPLSSSEPLAKPLFLWGILKVKIEHFKWDWNFQARLIFFSIFGPLGYPSQGFAKGGFQKKRVALADVPWTRNEGTKTRTMDAKNRNERTNNGTPVPKTGARVRSPNHPFARPPFFGCTLTGV